MALQILTAAAFLTAGFGTLTGYPMMVETFDKLGIGQWFRYVTGGIEVASAILLLIPRLTPMGAALLSCTMAGAVLSHVFLIGGSPVAALVLLCFAAIMGERAVVRIGTDQNDGELLVADLYIRPGGALMGEHVHPALEERFTVLRGRVGFRLSGRTSIAEPGVMLVASPGTPHDWWNAGAEEALVRVEVRPGARFAAFIVNAFGLAQDGRVDQRGMTKLLQLSLFAREFDDVIQFTRTPWLAQRILFGLLAPLARLLGYRGSYPEYSTSSRSDIVSVEPVNVATFSVSGSH